MTRILPLISAGALGPILDWMAADDARAAERLAAWDLSWVAEHPPERPVPLFPAVSLFVDLVRAHGPDLPCRMAMARGIFQLGPLGERALAAGTVGGAVHAVATGMPRHCTNEMITIETAGGGIVVRDLWSLAFDDDETAHAIQQYVAALFVSLFRLGSPEIARARIAIRPHPDAGIAHLAPWFGDELAPSQSGTLALSVPSALARSPLDVTEPSAATGPAADWPRLRTDDTLAESVRHLVRSMIGTDTPTIDRVAGYARMSRRSFQAGWRTRARRFPPSSTRRAVTLPWTGPDSPTDRSPRCRPTSAMPVRRVFRAPSAAGLAPPRAGSAGPDPKRFGLGAARRSDAVRPPVLG